MTREQIAHLRAYFGVSPMVAACMLWLARSPGRYRCALEMIDEARDFLDLDRDIDPRLSYVVHVHIARQALEKAGCSSPIKNLRGFGYAMSKGAAHRVLEVIAESGSA